MADARGSRPVGVERENKPGALTAHSVEDGTSAMACAQSDLDLYVQQAIQRWITAAWTRC